MGENKPGRPRVYASDADRVRAYRERQKESAASAAAAETVPTDPAEAATALAQVLPRLQQEAGGAVAKLSAIAEQITGAVGILGDPAALDSYLRRAQVTADKARADAAQEIEDLREQLAAALDDRANADAAAQAAEAETAQAASALADARRDHDEQLHTLRLAHQQELADLAAEHTEVLERWRQQMATAETEHQEKVAEQQRIIEGLRNRVIELGAEISAVRGDAERAAAAAEATLGRLESDLTDARAAITAERTRADDYRDELATSRAELAAARTQTDAAKERIEELRGELAEIRGSAAGRNKSGT
ncbi:hypothetical protein [Rhodococcus sp. T7]|uniref:hypothetical protein n=1 Tax=Rhodococcus sp. T7 TaxID=627444 RepID=UPI00135B661F|nr:hypothetical protein [Rhodococcus sp. T7]KAF0966654.1 Chromosome partition protein Smc [Rhodococcus sp. T7]